MWVCNAWKIISVCKSLLSSSSSSSNHSLIFPCPNLSIQYYLCLHSYSSPFPQFPNEDISLLLSQANSFNCSLFPILFLLFKIFATSFIFSFFYIIIFSFFTGSMPTTLVCLPTSQSLILQKETTFLDVTSTLTISVFLCYSS